MKVFVTGVNGQLGYDVMRELEKRGYSDAVGVDIEEMDITDCESVDRVITDSNPDVVIHCAAWTAVDLAEDVDKKDKVHLVNAVGTENIAKVCKKLDCKMIYISTDYVFDGQGTRPWEPDDERNPLNVYGQTKYEGELAEENKKQFYIPEGFAHGFLVLSDVAEFCYKVTDFYRPDDEGGIMWNDPTIGIEWPLDGIDEIKLSDKDKINPAFGTFVFE